jgi:hypothetical protein
MKKLACGLFLFIGLICRSDAQLDGEYTYDIASTFGKDFHFYEDDNYESYGGVCYLWFSENTGIALVVGTEAVHNPKTGAFRISGQSDFGDGASKVTPAYLNPLLPNTDDLVLTSATTTIIGKTYTSKSTGKPTIDISSGLIKMTGQYDVGSSSAVLVGIKSGSVSFKKSGIDSETAMDVGVSLKVSGSAVLNNRQVKKFNSAGDYLSGLYGGYPSSDSYESGGVTYNYYASLYLNLDIQTNGSAIAGTAELYTNGTTSKASGEVTQYWFYPLSSEEAKWWKYSVKGTSKNGIATLNLTGLGVIKGLKATIYIDEDTEEIIQNGKNSITLYGQTIKY